MLPPALSEEQSQALLDDARAGRREALDALILGHMRYVTALATRLCFVPQFLDEAISIAYEELCNAVSRIPSGDLHDGGGLKHDNVTGYIRAFVKGRVLREIKKYVSGRGESLRDVPYEAQHDIDVCEQVDAVTITAMECQIVKLSAFGHSTQEIATKVNRSLSYVAGVKADLLKRYQRAWTTCYYRSHTCKASALRRRDKLAVMVSCFRRHIETPDNDRIAS